jgi:predicted dehydrogenase
MSVSRRQFLEDSMFATTLALAGGSLAQAAAKDEKKQATSPNERLNVAIIGVNGRGKSHMAGFGKRKDTLVTIICDADEEVGMARVAEQEKIQGVRPKFVRDMREVFDDKSIDIVSTATPNHWHALVSIWAIQAGKDVYVEKPVSHNVSEGRRIVEAARKYNKICQTGTQCRSSQGTIDAIEFLKAGKLGEVKLARGLCYKSRGSIGERGTYDVPASVDYNLWAGPAPMSPLTRKKFHYDWHWQWETGNGDLGNQGIHQMDVARWGLGVNDLGQGVLSYGGRLGYVDAGDSANTQVCIHDYGTKKLVFEVRGLKTDAYPDPKDPNKAAKVGNVFYGSEGYLVLTGYDGGAAFDLKGNLIQKFKGGGDHFDNFVQAVRSRKHEDLSADILEGHLSSALCHLGNISYRLGSRMSLSEARSRLRGDEDLATFERFLEHLKDNKLPEDTEIALGANLAFDPKKEVFVGNEKADLMLTREYRAPFVVPSAGKV